MQDFCNAEMMLRELLIAAFLRQLILIALVFTRYLAKIQNGNSARLFLARQFLKCAVVVQCWVALSGIRW